MSPRGALNSYQGERTGGPEPGPDPGCDFFPSPLPEVNGRGSAAAGLHLDAFKACRGSRNTPETHVALSHVSFGCAQDAPRALNPSWKGRPLRRPRHSGGDPGRTRAGPGADPGRIRAGPGADPVQPACPRLCLRPLGACQIALPRVWEPSAAQCYTARCTVRALPG